MWTLGVRRSGGDPSCGLSAEQRHFFWFDKLINSIFKMRKMSTRQTSHAKKSEGIEGGMEKDNVSDHLMSDLSGRGEGLSAGGKNGGGKVERMGDGWPQVESNGGDCGLSEANKLDSEHRLQ